MSSSTITNTASGVNTNTPDSASKRYSLVKWLENSQFDAQNEWLGRLTSMPHSSIIDFDADELKAGMEISVIRNNGEIWRAQVIIPKIASNTIDLPPSSSKKIRTKAMGSGCKAVNLVDHHDTSSSSMDQSALIDLNDLSSTDITVTTNSNSVSQLTSLNTSNQNLIILTANNTTPIATSASSPSINSKKAQNNHNKEWQFLQTAINEANLSDFYHSPEQQQSANNSTSTVIKLNNLTTPVSTATNIVTVSDMNIETILQMQCDLLEQQKELKSIELETMEQLRLLQQNIGKLTRKFDSFETTCATYFPAPELKNAKKVLNTFNSSIKIVESELMKDYQPVITTLSNLSQSLIPSSSATSSSSSPTTTTTTVTLTNHSDMNNDSKSNTTIVNLLPSSTAQNDTKSNDDTIEHIESNNKPTTRAQGIQTQMALNRFLRESVKQKLGSEFLISHAVSDIPTTIMRQIKKEAFDKYLPNDQRPIKAWGLAMASLRCLKRDLVKNKNKQLAAAAMIAPAEQECKTVIDMDCDAEKIIDSDEVTCKTTRRSGINLTVASSLSYVPTRSIVSGITRRQLSLNNVSK